MPRSVLASSGATRAPSTSPGIRSALMSGSFRTDRRWMAGRRRRVGAGTQKNRRSERPPAVGAPAPPAAGSARRVRLPSLLRSDRARRQAIATVALRDRPANTMSKHTTAFVLLILLLPRAVFAQAAALVPPPEREGSAEF